MVTHARSPQVIGKKYKYLGLFTSEVDAAVAYDRAAVAAKRLAAQTNFDISSYLDLLSAQPLTAGVCALNARTFAVLFCNFAGLSLLRSTP
jgi:hypothetical protein